MENKSNSPSVRLAKKAATQLFFLLPITVVSSSSSMCLVSIPSWPESYRISNWFDAGHGHVHKYVIPKQPGSILFFSLHNIKKNEISRKERTLADSYDDFVLNNRTWRQDVGLWIKMKRVCPSWWKPSLVYHWTLVRNASRLPATHWLDFSPSSRLEDKISKLVINVKF